MSLVKTLKKYWRDLFAGVVIAGSMSYVLNTDFKQEIHSKAKTIQEQRKQEFIASAALSALLLSAGMGSAYCYYKYQNGRQP